MLPEPIADKAWLQRPFSTKCAELANSTLGHAQLFSGPVGVGKSELVAALAQVLLCVSPTFPKPCGECRGCKLCASHNHPDLLSLAAEVGKQSIGIDQVRQLGEELSKKSHQGAHRLVTIPRLESLTPQAANALLKILEEPPDNNFFLTGCANPGLLLPTVRSRMQHTVVASPSKSAALNYLRQVHRLDPLEAEKYLALTNGAPLQVAELHSGDFGKQRNLLVTLLSMCQDGALGNILTLIRQLKDFPLGASLKLLLACLRDLLCLANGIDTGLYFPDKQGSFRQHAAKLDQRQLFKVYDQTLQLSLACARGIHLNPQAQLYTLACSLTVLLYKGG